MFLTPIPLFFKKNFFIEFDLSLWDNANLGYVLDVADNINDNSYSLSYLYTNGAGTLNFNIDRKSNKLVIPLPAALLHKKAWFRVRLDFDLTNDNVAIDVNNTVYLAQHLGFKPKMTANIVFGKNQLYTEVPNMALRNLTIGDDSRQYFFPLNEWSGTVVHDSTGAPRGTVENPVWLINESFFWKPVYTHAALMAVAGLNFNPLDQNLFIFTHDSLITYHPDLRGSDLFGLCQARCLSRWSSAKALSTRDRTRSIATETLRHPQRPAEYRCPEYGQRRQSAMDAGGQGQPAEPAASP